MDTDDDRNALRPGIENDQHGTNVGMALMDLRRGSEPQEMLLVSSVMEMDQDRQAKDADDL